MQITTKHREAIEKAVSSLGSALALSNATGIDTSTLSRYRSGTTTEMSPDNANRLLSFLLANEFLDNGHSHCVCDCLRAVLPEL